MSDISWIERKIKVTQEKIRLLNIKLIELQAQKQIMIINRNSNQAIYFAHKKARKLNVYELNSKSQTKHKGEENGHPN